MLKNTIAFLNSFKFCKYDSNVICLSQFFFNVVNHFFVMISKNIRILIYKNPLNYQKVCLFGNSIQEINQIQHSFFGSQYQQFLQINRQKSSFTETNNSIGDLKKTYESTKQKEETAHNYEKELAYLKQSAYKGNAESQFSLGIFYYCGLGMKKPNKFKSFQFFKIASKNHHSKAQYCYGICLAKGEGVKVNKIKAVRYFRISADNGYDEAQYCYGRCLFNGYEIKQDLKEASYYFKKALDQGNKKAEFFYNLCFHPKINPNKYKLCF